MKHSYSIFLTFLLFTSCALTAMPQYTTVTVHATPDDHHPTSVVQQASDLVMGSIIGGLTGIGCHATDHLLPLGINWLGWMAVREALVRIMFEQATKKHRRHARDTTLRLSAWEVSWISYVLAKY